MSRQETYSKLNKQQLVQQCEARELDDEGKITVELRFSLMEQVKLCTGIALNETAMKLELAIQEVAKVEKEPSLGSQRQMGCSGSHTPESTGAGRQHF